MIIYYKPVLIFPILFLFTGLQNVHSNNEVMISERLSEKIPDDIWLIDENGFTVNLSDEITMPTIFSFVYYSCSTNCSPMLKEIGDMIDFSNIFLGSDYQIFTISINPAETHAHARNTKSNLVSDMERQDDAIMGWKFYVADSINIKKLTESLGYYYKPVGDEFIHISSLIFVNQDREIMRYITGHKFIATELQISLEQAALHNPLPTISKKDAYCYPFVASSYNRLHVIVRNGGLIILFFSLGFFLLLLFKPGLIKKTQ